MGRLTHLGIAHLRPKILHGVRGHLVLQAGLVERVGHVLVLHRPNAPDDGLVDSVQDGPHAPAPERGQPVVPANGHHHARDPPTLEPMAELFECPRVGGKPR